MPHQDEDGMTGGTGDGATSPAGSRLCVTCALCCDGVLHDHARVAPDEAALLHALGLTTDTYSAHLGFGLPCLLLEGTRCSIYGSERPRVCGAYTCELLKAHLAGDVTIQQAEPIIRRVRTLLAAVMAQLPAGSRVGDLRHTIRRAWDARGGPFETAAARQARAALLLASATLRVYIGKHFLARKSSTQA
ncbi:MAG: YkgJ family cysteine cluster protein [Acidobacteriota bacterium]